MGQDVRAHISPVLCRLRVPRVPGRGSSVCRRRSVTLGIPQELLRAETWRAGLVFNHKICALDRRPGISEFLNNANVWTTVVVW